MRINFGFQTNVQNIKNIRNDNPQPSFRAHGKPITLQYILEKRCEFLPERVLKEVKKILTDSPSANCSLLSIHKRLYEPLLACKSMDEVKTLFPEFSNMPEELNFKREIAHTRAFTEKYGKEFPLKMLQKYWANLETMDEIAKSFGLKSRSSLERALEMISFVRYSPNYKTILKASDEEGNRIIAAKTTAWNAAHPDLMYAHNKNAAQSNKTPEYRDAQSKRIKDRDKKDPSRKEKISQSLREGWQRCPEVVNAISEFARGESSYVRYIYRKRLSGKELTQKEIRTDKGFFKRFWAAHPELRAVYAEALKKKK